MDRNILISNRVEDKRNKKKIKSQVIEFNLNEMKDPESNDWLLSYINDKIKKMCIFH